jgi:sensor histidine kinase regulating citrate/malate metabolism
MALILPLYITSNLTTILNVKVNSALNAQEKEYYFAQCQLMQESMDSIKTIRHDMKFHLAAARAFTANNKSGEATDYIDSLLGSIEESESYSNTKNTAFDSIINFKLNNAEQKNIKLDIRLLIPPALNVEASDIVTIIGNLLDNALDAVSKVEDKKIKLDIEYSRESLYIQVENTFDGLVQYSEDAGAEGKHMVTRKVGGEHGHGFKNIRKSVEKYNGHIDISHDESMFSVVILLYVDEV